MKASIFLTALILSIPLPIASQSLIKQESEISQVLSGKLAYLEANYQKAFECLSKTDFSNLDQKTYWQLCHSAFRTGKAQDFMRKAQENSSESDFLIMYQEIQRAYQGLNPINDSHAIKLSKTDWDHMFQCLPQEQRLAFLDRLYTPQWLEYPSVRTFILEQLVQWGLNEDAFELATLGFERTSEEWIRACDLNFSHAQLQKMYHIKPPLNPSPCLTTLWFEHAIAVNAEDSSYLQGIAYKIIESDLSQEDSFHLAKCFLRHEHGSLTNLLTDALEFSSNQKMCLRIESALNERDLALASNLLLQTTLSSADQSFYKAQIAYYQKNYALALQYCQAIPPKEQSKESHVLQACSLAHTCPEKAFPMIFKLYRKQEVTHREISIVQIHMLSLKGDFEQASSLWRRLQLQERTSMKNISKFLDEKFESHGKKT